MLPNKDNCLKQIFNNNKALIGTVHCLALPGAPRYDKSGGVEKIINDALEDSLKYEKGGMDGIIIENGWDIPYLKSNDLGHETVATMTKIVSKIKDEVKIPVGVIINWNAGKASLAVAKATNASFIRVNQWVNSYISTSGYVEGESGNIKRYQNQIDANNIKILTDVEVKHGSHAIISDRSIEDQVDDIEFYDSDAIIVTGVNTGKKTSLNQLKTVKSKTSLPVIVGSGLTIKDAKEYMKVADGAIIGSSLKENEKWWGKVDIERVEKLVSSVKNSF